MRPPNEPYGGPFHHYIPSVISQCQWYQFYDILEEISRLIKQRLEEHELKEFSENINAILARDSIPWKLEECKVVRVFNPEIAERLTEVNVLLNNPKFKGPDEQFAKAVEHLNKRPNPDEENCIKDAVGALEAVANIIAETNSERLNNLLDKDPFVSHIPPTIRETIKKLYACRGAIPGVGHGQVGSSVAELADATWVLGVSAASILYFVYKVDKPAP